MMFCHCYLDPAFWWGHFDTNQKANSYIFICFKLPDVRQNRHLHPRASASTPPSLFIPIPWDFLRTVMFKWPPKVNLLKMLYPKALNLTPPPIWHFCLFKPFLGGQAFIHIILSPLSIGMHRGPAAGVSLLQSWPAWLWGLQTEGKYSWSCLRGWRAHHGLLVDTYWASRIFCSFPFPTFAPDMIAFKWLFWTTKALMYSKFKLP